MKSHQRGTLTVVMAGLALVVALPGGVTAQSARDFGRYHAVLQREQPAAFEMITRLERMQGLLYKELAAEGDQVRSREDRMPSPDFEFDMLDRLGMMAGEDGDLNEIARDAEAGYAALGSRAAAIIDWTAGYRRAVLGILADPKIEGLQARRAAIAEALQIYRSRPDAALPLEPKNMDVLYDHPTALAFRTGYADLDGLIWAGHWYKLAIAKPLLDLTGPEQAAGMDTVAARYYSKLTYGEPPEFFPSELPLAPAIAPELSYLSLETAAVLDNLSMMEEVLADVLASPDVTDKDAAIASAVDFFHDPKLGTIDPVEFSAMALRHGIFFQGGFPLVYMARSERNAGGHAEHLQGGNVIFPGMP